MRRLSKMMIAWLTFLIPIIAISQTSDSTKRDISAMLDSNIDYHNLIPQKDGNYMYENIIIADSLTKEELYTKAKVWFVQSFKSPKDVLQMDDKEAGRIIGKGYFSFDYPFFVETYTMKVYFTVDITVKDGKYRIQFYDIDPQDETKNSFTHTSAWSSETIPNMIKLAYRSGERKTYKRKLLSINEGFLYNIQAIKTALAKSSIDNNNNF